MVSGRMEAIDRTGDVGRDALQQSLALLDASGLLVFVGDVPEDQDYALDLPSGSANGRAAVGDLVLRAIPRYEHGVIGQADDLAMGQDLFDGVLGGCTSEGIDDPKDFGQRPVRRFFNAPAGEACGDRIHPSDLPGRVRGDNGISDRIQRDPEVALAEAQGRYRLIPLGLTLPDGVGHPLKVFGQGREFPGPRFGPGLVVISVGDGSRLFGIASEMPNNATGLEPSCRECQKEREAETSRDQAQGGRDRAQGLFAGQGDEHLPADLLDWNHGSHEGSAIHLESGCAVLSGHPHLQQGMDFGGDLLTADALFRVGDDALPAVDDHDHQTGLHREVTDELR